MLHIDDKQHFLRNLLYETERDSTGWAIIKKTISLTCVSTKYIFLAISYRLSENIPFQELISMKTGKNRFLI